MAPTELLLKLRPPTEDVADIIDVMSGRRVEYAPRKTPAETLGRMGAPGDHPRLYPADGWSRSKDARGGGGGGGDDGGGGGDDRGRDAPYSRQHSETQARREGRACVDEKGVTGTGQRTGQRRAWLGADAGVTSTTERRQLPPLYSGAIGNRARSGHRGDAPERTASSIFRGSAREGSSYAHRSGPGGVGGVGDEPGPRDFVEGCLGTERGLGMTQGGGEWRASRGGGGVGGGGGRDCGWRVGAAGDRVTVDGYRRRSTNSNGNGSRSFGGKGGDTVFFASSRIDLRCGGGGGGDDGGGDEGGGYEEHDRTTHGHDGHSRHDGHAKWCYENERVFTPSDPAPAHSNLRLRLPFPGPQQRLGQVIQSHQQSHGDRDGSLRTSAAAGTRMFVKAEEEGMRRGPIPPLNAGEWSQSHHIGDTDNAKVVDVDEQNVTAQLSGDNRSGGGGGGCGGGGGGGGDGGDGGGGRTRQRGPVWKGNSWSLMTLARDRSLPGASRDCSGGGAWDADRNRKPNGGRGGGDGGGVGAWG